MSRELPTIDLAGRKFIVDVEMSGLRNTNEPYNVIEFKNMEEVKTGQFGSVYRFLYNTVTEDLSINYKGGRIPFWIQYLEIPSETNLDLIAAARRVGIGSDIIADNEIKPQHHTARSIPRVSLMGTEFHVDTLFLRLQQVDNPGNTISFAHITVGADQMFLEYNVQTKNAAGLTKNEDPDAVAIVFLPLLKDIDPIGWEMAAIKPENQVIEPDKKTSKDRRNGTPRIIKPGNKDGPRRKR
jgi:hypothetical protein